MSKKLEVTNYNKSIGDPGKPAGILKEYESPNGLDTLALYQRLNKPHL